VAPDGNAAVVGSSGRLYSLTPTGALRWSVPSVGGDGGPSIGPDGTVYVGRGDRVTAVAPDGTIRWTYIEPSSGQGVIAGPTTLGGSQQWAASVPTSNDIFMQRQAQPATGPDGSLYLTGMSGSQFDAVNPGGDGRWAFFDETIVDPPPVLRTGRSWRPVTGRTSESRAPSAAGTP
jgi:hypothetical protein